MSIIPEELQEKPGPPVLFVGDFSANVEGYAWENDPEQGAGYMQFWYLSLTASSLQSIRAVWANLIKGEHGTLRFSGGQRNRFCRLWNGGPQTWKSRIDALPQATAHQLTLLPEPSRFEAQRPDFVLLTRNADDVSWTHMRYLRQRLSIPLLPEWEDWLWRRALYRNEAFQLDSSANLVAYRCEPNVDRLKEDIEAAGLAGELYVPPPKQSSVA